MSKEDVNHSPDVQSCTFAFITSQPTWLCLWLWYKQHLKPIPKEFIGVEAIPSSPLANSGGLWETKSLCLQRWPAILFQWGARDPPTITLPPSKDATQPAPVSLRLHRHMGLRLKAKDLPSTGCSARYNPANLTVTSGVPEAQQEPVVTVAQQN